MSWIFVALVAYLFLAVSNLFDKFLIDNVLGNTKAYVFIATLLSAIVFLASPWFLKWPGLYFLAWDVAVGVVFTLALWLLYEALKRGEASRVLVFVGGITPVFSIIFSLLFLQENFSHYQWLGLGFLLLGVLVIAFLPRERNFLHRFLRRLKIEPPFKAGGLGLAFLSALAYSTYFVASKYSYSGQPFASAFIWSRVGAAVFVLLFLIRAHDRRQVLHGFKSQPASRKGENTKHKLLVLLGQGFGSSGFLLQNYAVFLGSVALVNALQGVQYAFILVLSAGLAVMAPKLLKENFSWPVVSQKLAAVLIIGLGLYFIAFKS